MIKKLLTENLHPVKIWTDDIEDAAIDQLNRISNFPFIFKHVAVMPDVHAGVGSTIGSVIGTKGAIIPSTIGVDIGCGMMAVKIPLTADQISSDALLKTLRNNIEKSIPVGFSMNESINNRVKKIFETKLKNDLIAFKKDSKSFERCVYQMGSLGSGNHFIEICVDTKNDVWVMLHSGSRYIGKMVADKHVNSAKDLMKKSFIYLDDPELAYLAQETQEFKDYIHDMLWCQNYAEQNRNEMMHRVLWEISKLFFKGDVHPINLSKFKVNCHHNYSQIENHFGEDIWVTRKGAVSAQKNEYGIIPGSMGAKSYIVKGLGNTESFCSCSHGAGRRMSRGQAKRMFTIEDLKTQTSGIECRKDLGVIDEIPSAYKDIDVVMENQSDLVEIVETLKQIVCIKG